MEFANPHMCQLWGQRVDTVIGQPLFEAVPEVSSHVFKDLLDGVLATGVPYVGKELPARLDRHAAGRSRTSTELHLRAAARDRRCDRRGDDHGRRRDREVRAREQMSELHEAARPRDARRTISSRCSGTSCATLAPLQTSLHLLKQRLGNGGVDDLLGVMERQANNLARIVDDLLEASRISEGKIELRPEVLDFSLAVGHAATAAARSCSRASIGSR